MAGLKLPPTSADEFFEKQFKEFLLMYYINTILNIINLIRKLIQRFYKRVESESEVTLNTDGIKFSTESLYYTLGLETSVTSLLYLKG